MSAILVKMPPAMRSAEAPRDSPIAKPMKHAPAISGGRNTRMTSIIASSTEISTMPMLMPERSGMSCSGYGLPPSAACAVRELASVLTRMPYQATPYEPAMPISENAITIAVLPIPRSTRNR